MLLKAVMNSKQKKSYGYCAVCGKALSASEANDEYTQGKLCYSYANNPPEEPDYVNQKLKEAYPDEYYWLETGYGDSYREYLFFLKFIKFLIKIPNTACFQGFSSYVYK